jgi:hypothetical protein
MFVGNADDDPYTTTAAWSAQQPLVPFFEVTAIIFYCLYLRYLRVGALTWQLYCYCQSVDHELCITNA